MYYSGLYSNCVLVSVQVSIDNDAKYVSWVTAPRLTSGIVTATFQLYASLLCYSFCLGYLT